jgi:hypothetical protein
MPSYAHLDPATLAVRWDYLQLAAPMTVLGSVDVSAPQYKLLSRIFEIDAGEFETLYSEIAEDEQKRIQFLCTVLWHEQRHFFDYVFTNFGASLFRGYVELYCSFDHALSMIGEAGPKIGLPLTLYADPVRRRRLDVGAPSERLLELSKRLKERIGFFDGDHRSVQVADRTVFVGGHAQFEALAFFTQQGIAQEAFGLEEAAKIWQWLPDAFKTANVTRSAETLCEIYGIKVLHQFPNAPNLLDTRFLFALLTGSLMCRRANSVAVNSDLQVARHSPSGRLLALLEHFKAQGDDGRVARPLDAWKRVEAACQKLWGATPTQEMEADVEFEVRFLVQVKTRAQTRPEVVAAFEDFHALRVRLLERLKSQPDSLVEPHVYFKRTRFEVVPMQVLCFRSPWGDADTDSDTLFVGEHFLGEPGVIALIPRAANTSSAPFRLQSPEAWIYLMREVAPICRLLTAGRRHRSLLDFELVLAERQLFSEGVKVQFEPAFRYPLVDREAALYLDIRQVRECVCDFTMEKLQREDCIFLSPWDFFRYDALRDHSHFKRHATDIMNGTSKGEFGLHITHRRHLSLLR